MRAHLAPLVLGLLGLLGACSGDDAPEPGPPAESREELLRQLDAAVADVAARPEHGDQEVTVQHLLVGVRHPQLPRVTRTPEEAHVLAAEIFGRIRAGEDFDLLVKLHTDDAHPGIYTMALGAGDPPEVRSRAAMVPAFGDVAWRLAVGEVGIAAYDAQRSPFGYHLVKRLR